MVVVVWCLVGQCGCCVILMHFSSRRNFPNGKKWRDFLWTFLCVCDLIRFGRPSEVNDCMIWRGWRIIIFCTSWHFATQKLREIEIKPCTDKNLMCIVTRTGGWMEGYSDSRTATFVHMPEEELRAEGVKWCWMAVHRTSIIINALQVTSNGKWSHNNNNTNAINIVTCFC